MNVNKLEFSLFREVGMNLHVCIGRLMSKALRQWVHLFWALTALLAPAISKGQTMTMGGQFAVSQSGAATYRIPIEVPPGVGGMHPKLAFVYNSQAGNGPMGIGWGFEGLSTIRRCPQSMAIDGASIAINYTSTDRFCIDGQRLLNTNGSYGSTGSEYRTELDSFISTKVISAAAGDLANGPRNFEVKTKEGLTLEFGNTEDSRIEAQGKSVVRVWALNRMTDVKGNSVNYFYKEDAANGDYVIDRIEYGGFSSGRAAMHLKFLWELNSSDGGVYEAGSLIRQLLRLNRVEIYLSSALVGSYDFTYKNNLSSNDFSSRLSGVKRCSGDVNCMPVMEFSWLDNGGEAFTNTKFGGGGGYWNGNDKSSKQTFHHSGDFNGDGLQDFMYWGGDGWKVLLSNGSSFSPVQNWGSGGGVGVWSEGGSSQSFQFTGDFNGDGKTDFMYRNSIEMGWRVLLSSDSGFLQEQNWGSGGGKGYWSGFNQMSNQSFHFVGDFNGDGRTDFMYWNGSSGGWRVLISNGSGFEPEKNWGTGGGQGYWVGYLGSSNQAFHFTGDFNGDGKTDFMYWNGTAGGWRVLLSTGSGFSPEQNWGTGGGLGYWAGFNGVSSQSFHFTGDFNGDGKTDFMYWSGSSGGWRVLLSTGAGFSSGQNWGGGGGTGYWLGFSGKSSQSFHFVADFNGDGKSDFIYWDQTLSGWRLLKSLGSSFSPGETKGSGGAKGFYSDYSGASMAGMGKLLVLDQFVPSVVYQLEPGNPSKGYYFKEVVIDYNDEWMFTGSSRRLPVEVEIKSELIGYTPEDSYYQITASIPVYRGVFQGGNASNFFHSGAPSFQFIGDFNGDGQSDILFWEAGQWNLLSSKPSRNLINKISRAGPQIEDVTIDYSDRLSLPIDRQVTYPLINIPAANFIVTSSSRPSGQDAKRTSLNYSYGGLKMEFSSPQHSGSGRGMLGFSWMKTRETATGIESYTEFRQDFPYIGVPHKTETRLISGNTNMLLKRTSSQFDCRATAQAVVGLLSNASTGCSAQPGKVYFPYASVTDEESWDLNGVQMPRIRTSNSYSGVNDTSGTQRQLGDPTQIQVDLFEGSSLRQRKLTSNEYAPPNTSNWTQLGRLRKASVTSTNY